MNVSLSILQIILALHTAVGAVWKSSNSERTVPSLAAIPHGAWQSFVVLELLCAIGFVVPFFQKRLAILAPLAAIAIVAEMLFFSGVHLASGARDGGPVAYWLIVAALCAFVVYGRLVLSPIRNVEPA